MNAKGLLHIIKAVGVNFLSKSIGLLQSVVISWAFGIGSGTDYVFYFSNLFLLLASFFGAINQYVNIPKSLELYKTNTDDSGKYNSYVLTVYTIITLGLSVMLIFTPIELLARLSSFSAESLIPYTLSIKLLIPLIMFYTLNQLLTDLLVSRSVFVRPITYEIVRSVSTVLLIGTFHKVGILIVSVAMLIGVVIQFLLLLNLSIRKTANIQFGKNRTCSLEHFDFDCFYVVCGQLATIFSSYVAMNLLSQFPNGVYSAFDYGNRVNNLFSSIILTQISVVAGIHFIKLYNDCDYKAVEDSYKNTLLTLLILVIPISFVISFASDSIVSLFYARGKFDNQAVILTAKFLKVLILLLPPLIVNGFVTRLMIAKRIPKIASLYQISANVIFACMLYFFTAWWGDNGYLIGYMSFYYIYAFVICSVILKIHFSWFKQTSMNLTVALIFLINIFLYVFVVITKGYLVVYANSALGAFVINVLAGILYLLAYMVVLSKIKLFDSYYLNAKNLLVEMLMSRKEKDTSESN